MISIGIDIGTFNSAAAFADSSGAVTMVRSKNGETQYGKNFPSFVLFDRTGKKQLIGDLAKTAGFRNPELLIWGVKRLIGLSYNEAKKNGELERFRYGIEKAPDGGIAITVGGRKYSPSDIIRFILQEIKEDAENESLNPGLMGKRIEKAVISIPAYYIATRTKPILDAAAAAGFTKVETIQEPTAAAAAYGIDIDKGAVIMAFDMGAGTLDVSIMQGVMRGGRFVPGQLGTSGNPRLGGIDIDDLLLKYILDKYKDRLQGIENDDKAISLQREEIEKTKIMLSTNYEAPLKLCVKGAGIAVLSQGEVKDVLNHPYGEERKSFLERCRAPLGTALKQAGISAQSTGHVLFAGGPSYMPSIREAVKEELKALGARASVIKQIEDYGTIGFPADPMECVARGAALKAGRIIIEGRKTVSEGYGIELKNNFYQELTGMNSPFPKEGGPVGIVFDKGSLDKTVSLFAKLPDPVDSDKVKYTDLGDFSITTAPTEGKPAIDVYLRIDDNKNVTARLVQWETGIEVRYEGLNTLRGKEAKLQEEDEPAYIDPYGQTGTGSGSSAGTIITDKLIERYIHASGEVKALVKIRTGSINEKIRKLDKAISAEKSHNYGANISNAAKELINILFVEKQITEEENNAYMRELESIGRLKA